MKVTLNLNLSQRQKLADFAKRVSEARYQEARHVSTLNRKADLFNESEEWDKIHRDLSGS